MTEQIEQVLEKIRPAIKLDGGDVQFVRFHEGTVYVRLKGACVGCPASIYTVKLGIEQSLKEIIPGLVQVIALDEDEE